jgi:DNA adenine methylase
MFDRVKRAWAVLMLANSYYGAMLDGMFSFDRNGKISLRLNNRRETFDVDCAIRLQNTTIECCDALRIIQTYNTPETFFYCDPPYVGTNQGHYDGYTQDDFEQLLNMLSKVQGKFLLSSYRNPALTDARFLTKKQKIEVLTANYPIANKVNLE